MEESLSEISRRLGLNPNTLERWIRQGRIPISKRGTLGVYKEMELERWAENHRSKATEMNEDKKESSCSSEDRVLLSAIKRGGVFHGVPGSSKEDVLRAAVELIPDFFGKNQETLLEQLTARENLTSTGIGHGIAIPHPRNPLKDHLKKPMVTTCFLDAPVDFNSIDDLPVSILFLILSPSVECHLNLLSRLSFCLRDKSFIQFIHGAPDAESLLLKMEEISIP